jgi:very-short-patch-repair endonuclease
MGPKVAVREFDLANLAARQHGVVAVWQLVALGFSSREIAVRVKKARLHRVYRGVYAVGHAALSRDGRDMAAVLACGPGAVLSHWSAAARWELLRPHGGPFVIARRRCVIKGIHVYVAMTLEPRDQLVRDRIPITSVPRTLLDLAAVAPLRQLQRAANQAARKGRLNRDAVYELLERHPRRRGTKALRAVIAAVDPQTRRSRSDLETAFLALCRRYGIEKPVVNGKVAGVEVDMHWPGTGLIVELDGYEYHRTPAAFEADRRRDAQLKLAGYQVLRVGDRWLEEDPADVAATVKGLLRRHVRVDRVL